MLETSLMGAMPTCRRHCMERATIWAYAINAQVGDALRSKGNVARVNALLCEVLCHNICVVIQSMYEVGIEPDFGAGA